MALIPSNPPQRGDYVLYYGKHDNIIGGYLAVRYISPLTGNPRYLVVDSLQEDGDDGAGHWIGIENVHSINAEPVNDAGN